MSTGKLVSDAARQLNDWLEAGKFKEGARLPSERSIAETLGVKYYALNRAMGRLIAEGRVRREGYSLSLAAARPVSQRLVFHLIVARRNQHLASYRRAAANLDIELVVHDWVAAEEVSAILKQLDTKETVGVVCDPPTDSVHAAGWVAAARQLIGHGIPVICAGCWGVNGELSGVGGNVNYGISLGLSHLVERGHRELALLTFPSGGEHEMGSEDYWNRLCVRNRRDSSKDRIITQSSWLTETQDVDDVVDRLVDGPWKSVTGLVALVGYNSMIQSLFAELARRGRRVPDSLSVVTVGNSKGLAAVQPRVTAASFDMVLWFELTFDLLLREVREKRQFGAQRESSNIQVIPRLVVRESTRFLNNGDGERAPAGAAVTNGSATGNGSANGLRGGAVSVNVAGATAGGGVAAVVASHDHAELDRKSKVPYALAAKASLSARPRFAPVDLRAYVNRPLIFRRGWLGDIPLGCLPPGMREIHGVPFEILGGPNRADGGAVVFQSTVNTTGNAKKLPSRLVIPINGPVEAIYVLHGCGFAKSMQRFGSYRFYSETDEVVGDVQLVSAGRSPGLTGSEAAADAEKPSVSANIQDWWSDFPHVDYPHARMVPILEHDESKRVNRHVYLYTLEWINPAPKKLITHLEIEVDTSVPTTLGLLALTVVKPRGATTT